MVSTGGRPQVVARRPAHREPTEQSNRRRPARRQTPAEQASRQSQTAVQQKRGQAGMAGPAFPHALKSHLPNLLSHRHLVRVELHHA